MVMYYSPRQPFTLLSCILVGSTVSTQLYMCLLGLIHMYTVFAAYSVIVMKLCQITPTVEQIHSCITACMHCEGQGSIFTPSNSRSLIVELHALAEVDYS